MFSKLPDLFSREFAIGFFFPAVLFLLLLQVGLDVADLPGFLPPEARPDTAELAVPGTAGDPEETVARGLEALISVTLFTLLAWLLALLLAALNTPLYKLLEGYWGRARDALGLRTRQLQRLSCLKRQEGVLWKEVKEAEAKGVPFEKEEEMFDVRKALATRFPNNEAWVLPTSFGNILRAFETYSNTMFGIDAIPSWYRLLALIPEAYRKDIEQSKAYVDFWVNLWYLSLFAILSNIFLVLRTGIWAYLWFVPVFLILMWLLFQGAKDAAAEWGEFVKASIELYKGELQTQLSFPISTTKEKAVEEWQRYSSAITFRDPDLYPFAPPPPKKKPEV